jgi:excinuclease UvrABC nuclease subunit
MKADWSKRKLIDKIDVPSKPGVYLIIRKKPIRRIGQTDRKGILYIGQAYNLKGRLKLFKKFEHIASWFLYDHPEVAQFVLKKIKGL